MAKKSATEPSKLPRWFTEEFLAVQRAGIAHAFLLHGDIRGLVANPDESNNVEKPYIAFRKFIEKILRKRELVMFYNIASGLWFLKPEMEARFRQLAGLATDDDASSDDPVAAAKAGLAAKRAIPREPDQCLTLVEKVLRRTSDAAVVIDSVHAIAAEFGGAAPSPIERTSIVRLKNWGGSITLRKRNNLVLMITEQAANVAAELRQADSGIQTIFIPKPDKAERTAYINVLTSSAKGDPDPEFPQPKGFKAEALARAAQGMNLQQIRDIFLRARQSDETVDLEYVKEKKREILNAEYGDLMELVEPQRGLEDIGGLEYVKEYLRGILKAMKDGEDRLVAMGVTLMGPPGTGKTAIVEALAKEAGFNFVKTKNIRSMWVGQSEARQERLLYALRSLAPVVVMNDEADLNSADRDSPKGDSGVSERMMKMWMEFLSDPRIRGQIIVINCTNRPDRMDAALKRSGRSDDRILIPMPSQQELPDIFRVMFKRHGIVTKITDFTHHAKLTEGLSGADIERIVLNSYKFAFDRSEKAVDDAALVEAIKDFIPSASQAEIDRMTLMGILESSSRRLLPPSIREILAGIIERNLVEGLPDILKQINSRKIVVIETNFTKKGVSE